MGDQKGEIVGKKQEMEDFSFTDLHKIRLMLENKEKFLLNAAPVSESKPSKQSFRLLKLFRLLFKMQRVESSKMLLSMSSVTGVVFVLRI